MHISDGVLSPAALGIGWAITAVGVTVGMAKMDKEKIVRVSLMASAFFLASLVNVKVGPSSTHLSLLAPIGLVLGWGCFPAMFIALVLQALLFQFGGLLAIGVNCTDVAVPTLLCYLILAPLIRRAKSQTMVGILAFLGGALAVLWCACSVACFLCLTEGALKGTAFAVVIAHIPLMIIEGAVTAAMVLFLRRAAPDFLS